MADEQLTGQEPAQEQKTFPADYVTELRQEAASWRTKYQSIEKQLEKTAAERERQQLEAKGDYEAALKQATERAAQLEAQAQQAERYATALGKLLETERAGLPDYLITLLDKMDAAEQLEWLAANKGNFAQAGQTSKAGQAPFNPQSAQAQETDRQRMERLNRQRGQGVTPFSRI